MMYIYIAYPRSTIATEVIPVIEGSNVTLPCNVERPFLNKYTVTWTRNGSRIPPSQFDLELTNIPLSDNNTVYACTVETSIDQPEPGAKATATITLQCMYSKLATSVLKWPSEF